MAAQVKIFTTSWCGYCTAALRFLRQKGIEFEQIDADNPTTRKWLRDVTGRTTVPQLFINGRSIGGYTDLRALDEQGLLDHMLVAGHGSSVSG